MISVDTETTGTDLHHGNKPYLVTMYDDETDEQTYWEWDVDPLTRESVIPESDLDEIGDALALTERVLHNPVFDVKALSNVRVSFGEDWEWDLTHDTLMASHILATNKPHDLTSLALEYLGVDVKPFEDEIRQATNKARQIAKRRKPKWRIASPDLSDMPSVRSSSDKTFRGTEEESFWKADMWLPRAFVVNAPEILPEINGWTRGDDPEAHSWSDVCSKYANSDTAVTLPLHFELASILSQRNLQAIYKERMKLVRIVFGMQNRGVSYSHERLLELEQDYSEYVGHSENEMLDIALAYDYELDIPKGANNDSLRNFCFGFETVFKSDGTENCLVCNKALAKTERGRERWQKFEGKWICSDKCQGRTVSGSWLNLPVVARTPAGKPSANKAAMNIYEVTLDKGEQKDFIDALRVKRKLGKSLEYITSYKKFGQHVNEDWYRLNPSLNPCGTDTLRWSSHNPSQQVISKQLDHNGRNLRYIFGPLPGRVWYSLDYDNLELRIPAYECQEPAMLELFEHPDRGPYFGSYHLLIFSILHPDKYDHDDPMGLIKAKDKYKSTWYSWTKNGNFAELYGAVDTGDGKGTADIAFHVPGAQEIISKRLTEKNKLNRDWINYARKYGYVETMPDITVDAECGFPIRCKRSSFNQIVETVPLNYHVQGTACWVVMRAMIKTQGLIDEWNRDLKEPEYFMPMNIHDELVFDFPLRMKGKKDLNLPKVFALRRTMESIGEDIGVRLTCGLDRHTENWSKGKSL